MSESIDAVVTWVDGDDPVHREKRERFGEARAPATSTGGARFGEMGELFYCLRSILLFAPFIRRIHVVTDAQTPPALARLRAERPLDAERLVLVDHRDIFRGFEHRLPTFNSRTIETMLFRVPELAERFISFNDDMFLARPLSLGAVFEDAPVLHGRWRLMRPGMQRMGRKRTASMRAGYGKGQANAARLLGYRWRYAEVGHVPQPMRRSVFERFFRANPRVLDAQIAHRFRSAEQFVPASLARHLELQGGTALRPPLAEAFLRPDHADETIDRVLDGLSQGRYAVGCVQELNRFPLPARARIEAALDALTRNADALSESQFA